MIDFDKKCFPIEYVIFLLLMFFCIFMPVIFTHSLMFYKNEQKISINLSQTVI